MIYRLLLFDGFESYLIVVFLPIWIKFKWRTNPSISLAEAEGTALLIVISESFWESVKIHWISVNIASLKFFSAQRMHSKFLRKSKEWDLKLTWIGFAITCNSIGVNKRLETGSKFVGPVKSRRIFQSIKNVDERWDRTPNWDLKIFLAWNLKGSIFRHIVYSTFRLFFSQKWLFK